MTTLAEMLMPMVSDGNPETRLALEQALEQLQIQTDIVGFEAANKSLSKIRRQAERNVPSILTKGGNVTTRSKATLVISSEQFLELLGRITASRTKLAQRKPAAAILEKMEPIRGKGRSIDIGLGRHEEAVGGRIRF